MISNRPVTVSAPQPRRLRGWLIRRGLGTFEPPITVAIDEMDVRLGQPVLESILLSPLTLTKPTEDFALSSPDTWLWSVESDPLSGDVNTEDQFKPLDRVKVDGTIFLRESSQPKQLGLGISPQQKVETVRQKIISPSQRKPTPQAPQGLNLFELLLPILLPPEGVANLEGLVLPSPLYEFQNAGVAFLGEKESALLGDDMGLGKTVQAIVALRLLIRTGRIRGALIICNKAVLPQWKKHLDNWAPDVVWHAVDGLRERRRAFWEALAGKSGMLCHALLANYETIREDQDVLVGKSFDLVVLDEVQRIKNHAIGISRAINSLSAKRRWGLSGTPLETRIEDLHSIFSFLKPGLLRETDTYPPTVSKKIEPYFLRRRREAVLKDHPRNYLQDLSLALTPAQREAYDRVEQEGVLRLKSGTDVTVQHVLALITHLKQICNFDPHSGESVKADWVLSHLDEICEGGNKVLLFSQYVETLKILQDRMKSYQPLLYTGGLGDRQREEVIRTFKEDKSRQILLLSLRAGGAGLDLPEANFVFLYDLWWNPAVHSQAFGRVDRLVQTKEIFLRRILTADTIEERIDEKLRGKQKLFEEVIEGLADVDLKQSLTEEELFGLFGLKPPRVIAQEEAKSGWQQVDGSGFEQLIAKLYEAMGYVTKVTQKTRDGGIDIEGWRQQATGAERVLIQCKHWPDGLVGENIVRDLYGALSARQDVDRAELVTSGRISRDARRWAQGKRVRLVDGIELRSLLLKYHIPTEPRK